MRYSDWTSYIMLKALEKKEKLKRKATKLLISTYRLKHAAENKITHYKRKYNFRALNFSKYSRMMRANQRKTPMQHNQTVTSELKKTMQKSVDYIYALKIYTKTHNKDIPKPMRRRVTRRYAIPGYNTDEKTVAASPTIMSKGSTKTMHILNHPSEAESSEEVSPSDISISGFSDEN